ncbi:MAG: 30S ribosomal protein S6 [Thermodesulfovibrionia bacterium]|nr:30S ribosomal protein S6 [Thermodesulfovibrionia bacterium]
MNFYENLIILDTKLDDKSTENAIQKIRDLVEKQGGEILKTENWGRKKLAYELKKHTEGIYVLLLFKAPPLIIVELERFYKLFDPLVKFLIIKLNKKQIKTTVSTLSDEASSQKEEPAPAAEGDKNV